MRTHTFRATDATVEVLRRLRGAWRGVHVTADAVIVALADGTGVRVAVERTSLEPDFEVVRLTAERLPDAPPGVEAAGAFATGGNDVVVFRSESWIERPAGRDGGDLVMQYTGSPLSRPEHAEATCAVDDAVVIATGAGEGMLLRTGAQPGTLEVVVDRERIAAFLRERRYLG